MPEPQNFIIQSKVLGKSDQAIFEELKAAGWTDEQLQPHFPMLVVGKSSGQEENHNKSVQSAQKAKKHWPMLVGLSALFLVIAAGVFAAYQYYSSQVDLEELAPVSPQVPVATESAQLDQAADASASGKVVYALTDPETEDILIKTYHFETQAVQDLYTVSASDSATLTPGFWSPDGAYLPITVAANQPQVLIYNRKIDQISRYQAELSNPWEIVPGFLAYWTSAATVVISEEKIAAQDVIKTYEMSATGDVIVAETEPKIKYGTAKYTINYGLANAQQADLILTAQQVPVVLIKDLAVENPPALMPAGLADDAMWFISIEPAMESTTTAVLTTDPSSTAADSTASITANDLAISELPASDATASSVLGVTTPTGLETHLYGYSTTDGTLLYEDQVISTPGWLTSKILVHPQTKDFYLLEYQQLDGSGNGLVQLKQISTTTSAAEEEQSSFSFEFPTNTTSMDEFMSSAGQFDFSEDGRWFIYKTRDAQTGVDQIKAQAIGTDAEAQNLTLCAADCDWYSVYNPETLVPR